MDPLKIHAMPERFRRPVLIMAFTGWNDAAEAATTAARYLAAAINAEKFAEIDPEEFYHFGLTRPYVRFKTGSETEREVVWPATEFSIAQSPDLPRDIIVGVAPEPHLKWRAYTELAARLGIRPTKYEGPTGIVGVLNTTCRDRGLTTASLWANVPHYISGIENPKASLALLRRVSMLFGMEIDLRDLDEAGRQFDQNLAQVISQNKKIAGYVAKLESKDVDDGPPPAAGESDLPPASELVAEIEQFLRQQQRPE